MRPQSITIKLGETEWCVRPLTLRQVQEIEPLLLAESEGTGTVAKAVQILAIALGRDHSEAAASLSDVEATVREISAAMADVLRLGGFIAYAEADDAPGEAEAGVD
jgi:hypothetical protein